MSADQPPRRAGASPSRRDSRLGRRRRRQHRRHDDQERQGRHPAAARLGPKARRADRDAREKGLLRRHRRSIASSPASWRRPATRPAPARADSDLPNVPAEFNKHPFQARHRRHGAVERPEFRQFPVLHHVRRRRASSTASTRPSARSSRAWTSSTRSRPEPEANNGMVTNPDKIVTMRMAGAK